MDSESDEDDITDAFRLKSANVGGKVGPLVLEESPGLEDVPEIGRAHV